MGNQVNNEIPLSTVDFLPKVAVIKRLRDPRYGEVKLVRDNKTKEVMFLRDIIVNTKEAFDKELIFYNKRITVSHPNFVRIYGYSSQDQQTICSKYYKLSIFIEVLPKDLDAELKERQHNKIPFLETEILLIIENLLAGLSYFQTQNLSHGDIKPENIFISKNQTYKLSDPCLMQQNTNGLSLAIIGNTSPLLAPELVPQVPYQDFEIKCDKFKADVFSLGMTLLGLCTLTSPEELYEYDTGFFDEDLLNERLDYMKRGYSKFTNDLIGDMLKLDENERPDFMSLMNRLAPYQEDIRRKSELPFFKVKYNYKETTTAKKKKQKKNERNFEGDDAIIDHPRKKLDLDHVPKTIPPNINLDLPIMTVDNADPLSERDFIRGLENNHIVDIMKKTEQEGTIEINLSQQIELADSDIIQSLTKYEGDSAFIDDTGYNYQKQDLKIMIQNIKQNSNQNTKFVENPYDPFERLHSEVETKTDGHFVEEFSRNKVILQEIKTDESNLPNLPLKPSILQEKKHNQRVVESLPLQKKEVNEASSNIIEFVDFTNPQPKNKKVVESKENITPGPFVQLDNVRKLLESLKVNQSGQIKPSENMKSEQSPQVLMESAKKNSNEPQFVEFVAFDSPFPLKPKVVESFVLQDRLPYTNSFTQPQVQVQQGGNKIQDFEQKLIMDYFRKISIQHDQSNTVFDANNSINNSELPLKRKDQYQNHTIDAFQFNPYSSSERLHHY